MLVRGSYPYAQGRIAVVVLTLEVKGGGCSQGTVGVDRELVVRVGAVSVGKADGEGRIGVGVGGAELIHDGSRRQVLGHRGSVQIDRRGRFIRHGLGIPRV